MEVSRRSVLIAAWLLSMTVPTAAQSPLFYPNQTSGPATTSTPGEPPQRQVSWKLLPSNVLHDQKQVWLFPASLAHGRHWAPTAGLVFATAGLVALDPHTAPYFRQTQTFNQFNRVLSFNNTLALMAAAPITAYAVGRVRHDSYSQQTAELAAEAVLSAEIPALVTRDVARRLSPGDILPTAIFRPRGSEARRGLSTWVPAVSRPDMLLRPFPLLPSLLSAIAGVAGSLGQPTGWRAWLASRESRSRPISLRTCLWGRCSDIR